MYEKIAYLVMLMLLFGMGTVAADPCNPLLIHGKVYDVHGSPIGGVIVQARNVDTNRMITNGVYNVTATDGYQIQLGNIQDCWSPGNTIILYSEYVEGGYLYYNSVTVVIPIDILQQGDIIKRDLHLTQSNQTQPPPPGENRTHGLFIIYGFVTNSVGEKIDGANITISNENTNAVLTNATSGGGNYRMNIGEFTSGWRYNDRIKIVARYGSGDRQETGSTVFEIRVGQTQRQKDIQMLIIDMDFPTTYEGLLDLYFDLYNRYNQSSDSTQLLQDQIDYLNQQMQQMELNYSSEKADYEGRIAQLNSDVTNARNNGGNAIAYYFTLAVAIALAIYILLDKVILPWRRGELRR